MKHALRHNRSAQAALALLLADCFVFCLVDPRQASSPWLIVGYILLGMTAFGLCHMIAEGLGYYGGTIQRIGRRLLRYMAVAAVAVVGLQSIGALSARDLLALVPLMVLAYWYFGYGHRMATQATS